MWSLDAYAVQFFIIDAHTFEKRCECFPIEVGPMTSLLPVESDENMDWAFSVIKETLNSTFLCLFLERQMSCRHFECFSSKPLLLLFWRCRWVNERGLFEEMKWLGQVCCNIRVPEALLLSTMLVNQSQAVHYLLSSTAVKLTCLVFHFKSYKYLNIF